MEVNLTDDKVEDVMRQIQKGRGRVCDDAWESTEKRREAEELRSLLTDARFKSRAGFEVEASTKDKRSKADTKQGMEESGKKDQQVGSMSDKCQEMTKGPEGRTDPDD